MSKSFEQCVKLGVSVAVILAVVGGVVPGADKLLPLGGNPLAQIGACVGLAIGIFGVWTFFRGDSTAAPPRDSGRQWTERGSETHVGVHRPNSHSAAIVDEMKGRASVTEPSGERNVEGVRPSREATSEEIH